MENSIEEVLKNYNHNIWYYVKLKESNIIPPIGYKWIVKGNLFQKDSTENGLHYNTKSSILTITKDILTTIDNITSIREATPDEVEFLKNKYPKYI